MSDALRDVLNRALGHAEPAMLSPHLQPLLDSYRAAANRLRRPVLHLLLDDVDRLTRAVASVQAIAADYADVGGTLEARHVVTDLRAVVGT